MNEAVGHRRGDGEVVGRDEQQLVLQSAHRAGVDGARLGAASAGCAVIDLEICRGGRCGWWSRIRERRWWLRNGQRGTGLMDADNIRRIEGKRDDDGGRARRRTLGFDGVGGVADRTGHLVALARRQDRRGVAEPVEDQVRSRGRRGAHVGLLRQRDRPAVIGRGDDRITEREERFGVDQGADQAVLGMQRHREPAAATREGVVSLLDAVGDVHVLKDHGAFAAAEAVLVEGGVCGE